MNIFVIGCGRWGSLITWYLDHIGHHVTLYGRQSSPRMQSFLATRQNDLLTLPDSVGLTTDLRDVEQAETVIISIGSQSLRSLLAEAPMQALRSKTVVLCMKGLEMGTGERLSVIAGSLLHESNTVAVWLGPGHVQEFYRGIPNCMVIDSGNDAVKLWAAMSCQPTGCAIWGTTRPRCSRPTAITDSSASPSSAIRTTTGWRRAITQWRH